MAKFVTNLDLNTNQLQNVVIQPLSSDPANLEGRFYYNSTGKVLKYYNGSGWQTLGVSGTVDVGNATNVLAANHGGTGIANAVGSTITLGGALSFSGAFTTAFTVSNNTTLTLPTTGTVATLAGSEALTNKSINGLTVTNSTGTLTIVNGGSLVTAGAYVTTLTSSAATNVTLPTSGTLATRDGSETFTNKTITGLTLTAGTTTVDPLTFNSGPVLTTAAAGSMEFLTDALYFTITTGTARKTVAFLDSAMTGSYAGSVITGQYGGTGVANTGKTITIGGNFTTSGAYTTTLTVTGNTTVTLPTTGTLLANLMTTLGDMQYGGASGANTRLAGSTNTGVNILGQTVTGGTPAAPGWLLATGTGSPVLATSPTLVSPTLNAATATSINGLTFTASTGTLTLSTYTLTVSATASVGGTNTGDVTLAANSGLGFTSGQTGLAMGTPTALTASTTNSVTTNTHSHAVSGFVNLLGGTSITAGTTTVATGATVNVASGGSLTIASGATFTTATTPTNNNDVVNKQYVDNIAVGLSDWKESVRVTTTAATGNIANMATGAPNVVNGVTLANGNRVLVKNQTTASQNGIYSVTTAGTGANGVWARAADANTSANITCGMYVYVEEAVTDTLSKGSYVLNTPNPITLDTTGLTFVRFNGASGLTQGTGINITGDTISLATGIITAAGPTGNATTVPVITYNSSGQLTTVTTATISGVSPVGVTLNSANIWVGTSGNVAAAVGMSGVIAISNTGATSFANGSTGTVGTAVVLATSPSLTTPTLGVATATSINKVAITQPTTSATLTLIDGSTLATTGAFSTTLAASATTTLTLPGSTATLAYGVGSAANQVAMFSGTTGALTAIAVNSTATPKYLQQTSSGTPVWAVASTLAKFAQTMTGAGPSYGPYTHGLGSADITITIYDESGNLIYPDVLVTSTQITATYGVGAPTAVNHRLVAIG